MVVTRLGAALFVVSSVALAGCGLLVSLDGLEGPSRSMDGGNAGQDTAPSDASAIDTDTLEIDLDAGSRDAGPLPDGGGSPACYACLGAGKRCCEHYGTAATCVALGESCPPPDTIFNWGCARSATCVEGEQCCIVEDWMYDSGDREPRRSDCTTTCRWTTGEDQWRLCATADDCPKGQRCEGELRFVHPPGLTPKEIVFHHCIAP